MLPGTANPARILVVEDDELVAQALAVTLQILGYQPVGHANRGLQAIELAEQLRPDLVLMDIQLFGSMDGISAAQIIRDKYALPVVFVTAYADDAVLARAKLSEPYGYILKPFTDLELRTALEMALYQHQVQRQLQHSGALNRAILDSMSAQIAVLNEAGVIIAVNQAWQRFAQQNSQLIGPEVPSSVGCNYLSVCPAGEADGAARAGITAVLAGQSASFNLEYCCHSALQLRWFSMSVTPLGANMPGVVIAHTDITACKQVELALQEALRAKQVLLKEVNHRVKNNLQVVANLLQLETERSQQAASKLVLADMQGRIRAIALLHQMLYHTDAHASTDLGSYLQQLAIQAFRAANHSPQIHLELSLVAINVSLDQATHCGLLVNELISNSLKHAFPDGRAGTVRVHLSRLNGSGQVRVCVSDDGVSLPAEFYSPSGSGLGLQLVSDLLGQLGGVRLIELNGGFAVTFMAEQL
jgi:two-component sensor histidine kinase/AmiR/NasT family two-component response regulator